MKRWALWIVAGAGLLWFARESGASTLIPKEGSDYLAKPASTRFDAEFKFYAIRFGISNWKWLKAICMIESSLGEAASVKRGLASPTDVEGSKSSDGKSWGVMQTTLPTANDMRPGTTVEDLNDPKISIEIGAKYFAWLLKRYSGDVSRAVRAYNQGPGNEDKGASYAAGYLVKFNSALSQIS